MSQVETADLIQFSPPVLGSIPSSRKRQWLTGECLLSLASSEWKLVGADSPEQADERRQAGQLWN
jgi:hypothetical protein